MYAIYIYTSWKFQNLVYICVEVVRWSHFISILELYSKGVGEGGGYDMHIYHMSRTFWPLSHMESIKCYNWDYCLYLFVHLVSRVHKSDTLGSLGSSGSKQSPLLMPIKYTLAPDWLIPRWPLYLSSPWIKTLDFEAAEITVNMVILTTGKMTNDVDAGMISSFLFSKCIIYGSHFSLGLIWCNGLPPSVSSLLLFMIFTNFVLVYF